MKSRSIGIRIAALLPLVIGSLAADPVAQPQVSFTSGSSNTWNADWAGITERTYFMQWSLNLVNWSYAPVVEFSTGAKHYGINTVIPPSTASAPKLFIRLKYTDEPWVTTLAEARNADFDNDGIPNYFEVEIVGSDPFDQNSAGGDEDGDGLPDGWERYLIDSNLTDTFTTLADILPGCDFDNDGIKNLDESRYGLDGLVGDADHVADHVEYVYDFDVLTGAIFQNSRPVNWAYDANLNIGNTKE